MISPAIPLAQKATGFEIPAAGVIASSLSQWVVATSPYAA
jgi:hypothetical protein